MPTVTVIARETFPYAGITRYAGDVFEATEEDARILRYAQRIKDDVVVATHATEPESVEAPASEASDASEPRRRRNYRRKDLTADPE